MSLNILVIEDSPADFLLLKRYFKEINLDAICTCVDSDEGLNTALVNSTWDVVLADYIVPSMHFANSLSIIKQHAEYLPVILVSGELLTTDAVQLLRDGLSDFVPKNDLARLPYAIFRSIAEGKDKRAKRESELALRRAASVFEYAQEGIVISDAAGIIVDVNRAFVELSGYTRAELLGKSTKTFASGRHDKLFYAEIWKSLLEQGIWRGEMWDRRKNGELFVQLVTISVVHDNQGHIQNCVALYADISALKEYQQQLEEIAHYDTLTGLPNRLLFTDRLQQAMLRAQRNSHRVGIAYLDLDGFKQVNDQYGHQAGDQLLIDAAKRMRNALRENDTVARLGGDEFVIILQELRQTDDYGAMLDRLLKSIAEPFTWQDKQLHISASIGVTFFARNDNADPKRLLAEADQAMYQAKQLGKNRFCLFG